MGVILGISNSHNGSVALIVDGQVKVAIQAERISVAKDKVFPLAMRHLFYDSASITV